MKLTKTKLKQIIKEELKNVVLEKKDEREQKVDVDPIVIQEMKEIMDLVQTLWFELRTDVKSVDELERYTPNDGSGRSVPGPAAKERDLRRYRWQQAQTAATRSAYVAAMGDVVKPPEPPELKALERRWKKIAKKRKRHYSPDLERESIATEEEYQMALGEFQNTPEYQEWKAKSDRVLISLEADPDLHAPFTGDDKDDETYKRIRRDLETLRNPEDLWIEDLYRIFRDRLFRVEKGYLGKPPGGQNQTFMRSVGRMMSNTFHWFKDVSKTVAAITSSGVLGILGTDVEDVMPMKENMSEEEGNAQETVDQPPEKVIKMVKTTYDYLDEILMKLRSPELHDVYLKDIEGIVQDLRLAVEEAVTSGDAADALKFHRIRIAHEGKLNTKTTKLTRSRLKQAVKEEIQLILPKT